MNMENSNGESSKNSENFINPKLLICVRHGERTDHVGLKPVWGEFDPELTEKGEKQALNIGKIIRDKLIEHNIKGRILVVSSPFGRTLQTSKNIIKGLQDNNNLFAVDNHIHIQNLLCEYIEPHLVKEGKPEEYLCIYNNHLQLLDYLEDYKITHLNEKTLLPQKAESVDECYERLKRCAEWSIEHHINDEEIGAIILVSHGTPIDNLNKVLGYPGPFGWHHIEYCNALVYRLDKEDKSSKYLEKLKPNLQD